MNESIRHLDPLTFPLHGVRLIEASAGTGKTFSIAALYVRLVLGHGRGEGGGLMPPNILVLTFTRAATQELRDRIRNRLTELASAFRTGNAAGDDFARGLLDEYREEARRAACARRLQVAAEWMDEAAIHTIHAWCQTMLRQHAFDSGSLFEQEVDSQDPTLFQQVVNDYWRRFMYRPHPLGHRLQEIAGSPEELAGRVMKLLGHGLEIRFNGRPVRAQSPKDALDEIAACHQRLADRECSQVLRAWTDAGAEVRGLLDQALSANAFYAASTRKEAGVFRERLPALLDALDRWEPGRPAPEDLAWLRADALEQVSKKNKAPAHAWFDELAAALDRAPEAPHNLHSVLPHAAAWIQARHAAEKRRQNRLDFDDLLINLDRALSGEHAQRLRTRILQDFPFALIDEFQDTDPVQYRIFEQVYLPEKDNPAHGLFMIGDPKQSIYSFRGADIHTYLMARSRTTAGDRFTLPRNYRSSRAMVEAVNRLFETGAGNPRGAFGFAGADEDPVPFHPVECRGRSERLMVDGQEVDALTFWYQPPPPDKGSLPKNAHEPLMADLTASRIIELLNGSRAAQPATGFLNEDGDLQPIRPADIAVLVNDRFQAAMVQHALRKRGADSVYLSERDSVFEQPEAVDLLTVLEAVAQPHDDQLVRNALGTASLCTPLEELDALNRHEQRLDAELQFFSGLHRAWREHGVLAMVRRLLTEKNVAARLMAAGGGERALTNLLHLAELLQQASESQEGEQGLINWFQNEIARENRTENEDQVIRLESDADLIRIVTIFKSKGLEYPLVFVPFAGSYKSAPKDAFVEYHDDRGRRIVELGEDPDATQRRDREALQERVRLFYVAVTRARHACWVGTGAIAEPGRSAPGYLLGGRLEASGDQSGQPSVDLRELLQELSADAPMIAASVVSEQDVGAVRLVPDSDEFVCRPALKYSGAPREDWWIASYSALRHGKGLAAGPDDAEDAIRANLDEMTRDDELSDESPRPPHGVPAPGTIHAFPRGAMPGNFLHLLLEWAGQQGFARVLERPDELQLQIRERLARYGWQNWTETVQRWLQAQLVATIRLGDARLRLVDLAPDEWRYKSELEFWFEAGRVDVREIDEQVSAHTLDGSERAPFDPNVLNGMLHGFIDLVFEHQGRWYVADYKSNWIGPDAGDYTFRRMAEVVRSHRYDMQYVLYTLALHRLLKSRLGAGYDPEKHLGGAAYLFLRGCDNAQTGGVFFEVPSVALIQRLDRLFSGREVHHAA